MTIALAPLMSMGPDARSRTAARVQSSASQVSSASDRRRSGCRRGVPESSPKKLGSSPPRNHPATSTTMWLARLTYTQTVPSAPIGATTEFARLTPLTKFTFDASGRSAPHGHTVAIARPARADDRQVHRDGLGIGGNDERRVRDRRGCRVRRHAPGSATGWPAAPARGRRRRRRGCRRVGSAWPGERGRRQPSDVRPPKYPARSTMTSADVLVWTQIVPSSPTGVTTPLPVGVVP